MLGREGLAAFVLLALACAKSQPDPASEGTCAPAPAAAIFTCDPLEPGASGCGVPPDEMGKIDADASTQYPPGCLVVLPYQNSFYPCSGGETCRCEVAAGHPDASPNWACGP
jgi:hypothetical protein